MKRTHTARRLCSIALSLLMLISLFPVSAFAAAPKVNPPEDKVLVSQKSYSLIEGVTETHVFLNNESGDSQIAGFLTTVSPNAQATFKASYSGYYTAGSTVDSRRNTTLTWKLEQPTKQAANYEKATGGKVISVTNADFFNMQTGQPLGYLIMEGNVIQTQANNHGEPYFAVLKDGTYAIRDYGVDHSDVVEAVSGPFYLVRDGKNVQDPNQKDRIPVNSIGIKSDGTVVTFLGDGRQAPYSVGMTLYETAQFLVAQGVKDALYLDGGGSAMLASRHEGDDELKIQNSPSDGSERSDSSILLLVLTGEESSAFDHAAVSPNAELYTPNSEVQFTAIGVSNSGGSAALPEDGLSWALSEDSANMGSISNDGLFKSNGTIGEVTAVLNHNGKEVGSSTISIVEIDELYFGSSSISLDFSEQSSLGLVARYKKAPVHFKDGDFVWNTGDGSEGNPTVGEMHGNLFEAVSSGTVNGTVTVSYTKNDGTALTASIRVEVGKLPSVAFDFEERDGVRQTAAHYHWSGSRPGATGEFVNAGLTEGYRGKYDSMTVISGGNTFGNYTTSVVNAPYIFTGNYESAVPAADVFRANGYSYYLWPNASIKSFNTGSLNITTAAEGGQVRFGDYSLELNYDFRSFDNSQNSNWYIRYCGDPSVGYPDRSNYSSDEEFNTAVVKAVRDSGYYIDGAPQKLGVWIYADKGSYGFVPYADIQAWVEDKGKYKTFNFQLHHDDGEIMPSGEQNKSYIDWVGWKYCYADLSSIAQYASSEHPLAILPGTGLFWFSYQPGSGRGGRYAGTIYYDNYRFVYGADLDDLDNPVIDSASINDVELNEDTPVVLDSGSIEIVAKFSDPEGANASGINATATTFKIDGKEVGCDGDTASAKTRLELGDGEHSVTISVYDGFGNTSSKTYYFVINTGSQIVASTLSGEKTVTMGEKYVLNLKAVGDVRSMTMNVIQLNSDFGEPTVQFADGWTGEYAYTETGFKKAKLDISASRVDAPAARSAAAGNETEIAKLIFNVPSDMDKEIDFFTYQVVGAESKDSNNNTFSASQPVEKLELSAYYELSIGPAVAGFPTEVTVTDINGEIVAGAEVYVNDALAGTTDENGVFTVEATVNMTEKQTFTLKAVKDTKVSFISTVTVVGDVVTEGKPVGVTLTASKDGSCTETVTWLSGITSTTADAVVRYSTSEDMSNASTVKGTSNIQTFATSKHASRINAVEISGLEAGCTYYYQVGDGNDSNWSEVSSFKTVAAGSGTKFFVIGDTQMSGDPSVDAEAIGLLNSIAGRVKGYDFGIQTGDYVDNGGNYPMWAEIQNEFGTAFSGIDMIHTLGNHEYFGDAEGVAANRLYNRSGNERLYYSVEYGNMYIAVINYGANLTEALEWLKQDAAASDAAWKVLSIHQPAYYTNVNGGNARFNKAVPAAADAAGIDVVFSGHDHSYARTERMTAGNIDNNSGTVYFICGDLGEKSRDVNYKIVENPEFNFAFTSQEYGALYLDVTALDDEMTVSAKNQNGEIIDSVVINKSCTAEGHNYTYDRDKEKLFCSGCRKYFDPADVGYTGFADIKNSNDKVYFFNGKMKTDGFFTVETTTYHAAPDGIVHDVTTVDTRTCTKNGAVVSTSNVCHKVYTGSTLYAEGHDWDENHVCKKCKFEGIDINDVEITTYPATYKENGYARCAIKAVYNDRTLKLGSGAIYEGYVTYSNNTKVGIGTVTIRGQFDFYGETTKEFKIVPDAIKKLNIDAVSEDSITLSWDRVPGAEDYRIEYKAADGKWKRVLTTDNPVKTEITINDLEHDTEYSFRAYGFANVDGTYYSATRYSPVEVAKTAHVHTTVLENAKAATCTEAGYTGDEVCKVCNTVVKQGEAIAALGHKTELRNEKAATCTEAGYTGDEVCTACNTVVKQGEAIAALGHKTELRNEKAATCTEAGYTGDEVCTVCNAVVKQGSYTEKLPHTYKDGVCTACGGKDSAYKPPIDNVFADVNENDYFYEAVHWAINHDPTVTTGTDATHFSPEEACTRAQAVTFLWRSAGCPKPTTDTCAFTDVPEDAYYYNAVLWAVENKITTGVSETEFSPDEKATRAQMVTFLYRLEGEPKVENITNGFADVDANEYYYNAVLWAIDKGITNGMDETHFGPSEICNRAHSVTFVFRYVNAK